MADIIDRIKDFNAGRDPERLAMKYARLRASPFGFLRGTCHLFYDELPGKDLFTKAPLAWVCGDAHLENFGSYKGDNRLVYFDLNDFDEAALAPVTWDLVRFLCSVLVAGDSVKATTDQATELCKVFCDAYACALLSGKMRWIERDTAQGLIHALLSELRQRRRPDFLDRRTVRKGQRRTIRCDGKHALVATEAQRARITKLIDEYAATQHDQTFFEVLDVARRIAGTGSLGVDRYVVLVAGKGSPDGNYLLDLKEALPSTLDRRLKIKQPAWRSEAHRVVEIQRRMQAVSMAFLHPIARRKSSYILRGLQPSEDRIVLGGQRTTFEQIGTAIREMGHIMAWAHLRASGRQGSANADELIDFAASGPRWTGPLMKAARDCARGVGKDWKRYCAAYDDGELST